jgi:hypothetical protein
MRIGFLGLGNMGTPMALRLLAAGHELSVWNRSEGRTKPLIHEGAIALFCHSRHPTLDLATIVDTRPSVVKTGIRLHESRPNCFGRKGGEECIAETYQVSCDFDLTKHKRP